MTIDIAKAFKRAAQGIKDASHRNGEVSSSSQSKPTLKLDTIFPPNIGEIVKSLVQVLEDFLKLIPTWKTVRQLVKGLVKDIPTALSNFLGTQGKNSPISLKNQHPFLLSPSGIFLQVLIQATIIITTITLWILSDRDTGILTVSSNPEASFSSSTFHRPKFWVMALLWTVLPTLITGLYKSLWAQMTGQLKDVQPVAEMRWKAQSRTPLAALPSSRSHIASTSQLAGPHSTTERTLLLNYGSYLPVQNIYYALKYRHIVLALVLLAEILLFVASGVSANVLAPAPVPMPRSVAIQPAMSFMTDENIARKSMQGAFDAVYARLLHSGAPTPWTSLSHSYTPVTLAEPDIRDLLSISPSLMSPSSHNLTLSTLAYSGELLCVPVPSPKIALTTNTSLTNTRLVITFTEGGCAGRLEYILTDKTTLIATTAHFECQGISDEEGSARYRAVFLYANYNHTCSSCHLTNMTLLSCIPHWYSQPKDVVVSFNSHDLVQGTIVQERGEDGGVDSSAVGTPGDKKDIFLGYDRAMWLLAWLNSLQLAMILDARITPVSDRLGWLTLEHARNMVQDGDEGPDYEGLDFQRSFGEVFGAMFATFVSLEAFAPVVEAPQLIVGEEAVAIGVLDITEYRLFIVKTTAITFLFLLGAVSLITLVLGRYVSKRGFILRDCEVDGIFGAAMLLHASGEVENFVRDVKQKAGNEEVDSRDIVKWARKDGDISGRKCWIDGMVVRVGGPVDGICLSGSGSCDRVNRV